MKLHAKAISATMCGAREAEEALSRCQRFPRFGWRPLLQGDRPSWRIAAARFADPDPGISKTIDWCWMSQILV